LYLKGGAMKTLTEFVRQEKLRERPSGKVSCPYCGGHKVRLRGHSHTLIGGGDGTPNGDPNHNWVDYSCSDCGQSFVREYKSGNVWYTDSRQSGKVLRGLPNCFERYVYTCAACDGEVTRRYADMDGTTPVTSLSSSWEEEPKRYVRHYRTFFGCASCGASIDY
jgi:DNA-directed RNA polymerase subunit RPC12/RpoP